MISKSSATLAPTDELRPAGTPPPGLPEPVQAAPAEGVPDQSAVPAASAVPSPVHTRGQSVQGGPLPGFQTDSHAPAPMQAVHPQSTQLTPSLPQQQQREAGGLPWFSHGLPMLLVDGQWVRPKWPAPPGQPRPKLPHSRWQQLYHDIMAAHPEWGDSQEGRQRGQIALQQMQVEAARKAFGQPGDSHLQQPQARVQQPAAQTGVHSVQGLSGRWYHTVPLKPEPQPWCTFCKEQGHSTLGCLPFAYPALLGDNGWDPVTGEMVSGTHPPGHLHARASCVYSLHSLLVFCSHQRFLSAAREGVCH